MARMEAFISSQIKQLSPCTKQGAELCRASLHGYPKGRPTRCRAWGSRPLGGSPGRRDGFHGSPRLRRCRVRRTRAGAPGGDVRPCLAGAL